MSAGRPTKYKDAYVKQAYGLCLLGATDSDLAAFFEVDEATLNRWKLAHDEFRESIKTGKEIADIEVAEKLHKRATGYDYKEDVAFKVRKNGEDDVTVVSLTKHAPPDTTAMIFWLKNRKSGHWRDKQEVEQSGTLRHVVSSEPLTDEEWADKHTQDV